MIGLCPAVVDSEACFLVNGIILRAGAFIIDIEIKTLQAIPLVENRNVAYYLFQY